MKDSWIIGILSAIFVSFMVMMLWSHMELTLNGRNDFAPFYGGAQLLESGQLYNREALMERERQLIGVFSDQHGYIRLPFHAAFVWPLTLLPYMTAYCIWEAALILSGIAFVFLWRPPGGNMNVLLASMSFPVFAAIANGQDTVFLLLILAVMMLLYRGDRKFLAGVVYSLCAIKFHLFLLTPLVIFGKREWRFARGFLSGGAVLAAISFAVAGWRWPIEFLESAVNPEFSPKTFDMTNLHGVMLNVPGGWALEIIVGLAIAAAVWVICRRTSFEYALAATLIGSYVLSIHAYLPDLAITLPAVLIVIAVSTAKSLRTLAFLLAVPPLHLLYFVGYPASAGIVAVLLAVIGLMLREALQADAVKEDVAGALLDASGSQA